VGALVISPTRELAMQIFDTLRCAARALLRARARCAGKPFGAAPCLLTRRAPLHLYNPRSKCAKQHAFSAGLLIGGKDVEYERQKVNGTQPPLRTASAPLRHLTSPAPPAARRQA
jgi:superfamily II DNA/RNA helicase